jgi:hypothetical protein
MDHALLFKISNTWAALSWLTLILFYHQESIVKWLLGTGVLVLSVVYVALLIPGLGQMNPTDFNSLDGVMRLFSKPEAVLTGWIHYLAFDLFTGLMIAYSAQKRSINRWVMVPIFFFTFMLGPVGFLLYMMQLMFKEKTLLPNFK